MCLTRYKTCFGIEGGVLFSPHNTTCRSLYYSFRVIALNASALYYVNAETFSVTLFSVSLLYQGVLRTAISKQRPRLVRQSNSFLIKVGQTYSFQIVEHNYRYL